MDFYFKVALAAIHLSGTVIISGGHLQWSSILKGSFKKYVRWGGEGGHCVRSLFKKNAEIFKMKIVKMIVILKFFLWIIKAAWNIKQTIMKDYNIQSCQWMECNCFRQSFLLRTIFCSFLCTVHYFLFAFSAKMATYSLVIDNIYFVISS